MKSIYEFLLNEHLLNEHLLKAKTAASTQDTEYTDYVDLGLPSGRLWAKCNIGADEPYEYGDYFMWGNTEPDTDKSCFWKTCPFNNGANAYDKDYFKSIKNKICPNDILAPEYDAATAILGDDWRLPTYDDFTELIDNTTRKWVNDYHDSGIAGKLLKADSIENDAELFIPASGYRGGSGYASQGSYGFLWSSSITIGGGQCSWYLYMDDMSLKHGSSSRCYGLCVRPVKENK